MCEHTLCGPAKGLLHYKTEVIESIRKEFNLNKKEDREKAIAVIEEWIQAQDHFVLKEFNRSYIETCLITSNGSIERTKQRIDKLCTMRTMMPQYFQTTNIQDTNILTLETRGYISVLPNLTKDYYRVIMIKVKPGTVLHASDYTLLYKFMVVIAEYLVINDYCRGFILVADIFDCSVVDCLAGLDLLELRQFLPVITQGYGCHIKGIIFVTASKVIDNFIRIMKPVFSEKIGSRIHAVTSREKLRDRFSPGDILPEIYGGKERPIEELYGDLVAVLSSSEMIKLLETANKAVTDESKRRIDKFNDQYMGMAGCFRTLSLD